MALQNIINTILEEANKKAERIRDETVKKIKIIEKEYKDKAKEEENKILDKARDEQRRILDEAKFEARLSARKKSLTEKQRLISEVFKVTADKLSELPDDEYLKFLVFLLKQTPKLEEKVEIVPVKGKEKITEEAIKKVKGNYVLSNQTCKASGGFILKSRDIEIGNTFETLLKEKREELETKIARILFK